MALIVKLQDVGDGKGFIPIPDAILRYLGWTETTDLEVEIVGQSIVVADKNRNVIWMEKSADERETEPGSRAEAATTP